MTSFYKEFPTTTEKEWLEKVQVDLKGKSIEEALHKFHPIEQVNYTSYGLSRENQSHSIPGQEDYSRGGKISNNDWTNCVLVPLDSPKKMNAFALKQLMNGATGLKIDLANFSTEDCKVISKDIGFEHITSSFFYSTKAQFDWLSTLANEDKLHGSAINTGKEKFGSIKNTRSELVKAIEVQYAGGNATQEIAYALHKGHEVLFRLINEGLAVDDAAAQIKFQFGIGSNFFFELTKFKVFRSLWYTVVNAYQPAHNCTSIPYVEAETGFLNKSLKDPHNNLLRQTTEALAAVLGGIDELTIRPYNAWSTDEENIEKVQRLGLNIALLLKEESYLDKVIDPAGGAYILDDLLKEVRNNSWEVFQKTEKEGINFLKDDIQKLAKKRIQLVESKNNTLIGVNKYFNETPSNISWNVTTTTPFGSPLILEQDCNVEI
ncbi:MAG TPA: methylmalonyl-CoA mutase family protein [Brumimicrobium sp.]|nr:methylmalonyl-CoA mutase family protein [Brumimicrobium sp.]